MEEYKPNSNKFKTQQKTGAANPSEKKIEKVVTGTVKTKKKSEIAKLTDVFISEDISNVKSYILMDVLVPSIKEAIGKIIKNGIDMLLWGSTSSSGKSSLTSKISYNRYYNGSNDPRDNRAVRSHSGFDYDDIIFDNRGDAEAVLSAMEDIIDQFGVASIGDLYDLAQVSTHNYSINKYGWTDLRVAEVVRVRDGWMIKFPKALPLN